MLAPEGRVRGLLSRTRALFETTDVARRVTRCAGRRLLPARRRMSGRARSSDWRRAPHVHLSQPENSCGSATAAASLESTSGMHRRSPSPPEEGLPAQLDARGPVAPSEARPTPDSAGTGAFATSAEPGSSPSGAPSRAIDVSSGAPPGALPGSSLDPPSNSPAIAPPSWSSTSHSPPSAAHTRKFGRDCRAVPRRSAELDVGPDAHADSLPDSLDQARAEPRAERRRERRPEASHEDPRETRREALHDATDDATDDATHATPRDTTPHGTRREALHDATDDAARSERRDEWRARPREQGLDVRGDGWRERRPASALPASSELAFDRPFGSGRGPRWSSTLAATRAVAQRAVAARALRAFASAAALELRDALHPPLCAICGAAGVAAPWCELHRLPERPAGVRCPRCASRVPEALRDATEAGAACAACRQRSPRIERLIVLGDYRDRALREWILAFKHGGRADLAAPLGAALAAHVASSLRWDDAEGARVLCPVPLHRWRRLARGYDQARELGSALAAELGAPCQSLLRRTRATAVQGASGSASRDSNVRGAFVAVRPGWWSRLRAVEQPSLARFDQVWLVDDVVTSGATLRECARALRRAGARWVGAMALARAHGAAGAAGLEPERGVGAARGDDPGRSHSRGSAHASSLEAAAGAPDLDAEPAPHSHAVQRGASTFAPDAISLLSLSTRARPQPSAGSRSPALRRPTGTVAAAGVALACAECCLQVAPQHAPRAVRGSLAARAGYPLPPQLLFACRSSARAAP